MHVNHSRWGERTTYTRSRRAGTISEVLGAAAAGGDGAELGAERRTLGHAAFLGRVVAHFGGCGKARLGLGERVRRCRRG